MVSSNSSNSNIKKIHALAQSAGFSSLTPLQEAILSRIAGGENSFINTHNQRGRTLGVLLAILSRLEQKPRSRALVIAPESKDMDRLRALMDKLISSNKSRHISITLGPGRELRREHKELSRNPDIIIGNPDRIIDHIRRTSLSLQEASLVAVFISRTTVSGELTKDLTYIFSRVPEETTVLFLSPEKKDLTLMKNIKREPLQIYSSQNVQKEGSPMHSQRKEFVPNEESIKETLTAILGEIRTELNPHELDGYKKLLKKYVHLTMRSYVGAYFLHRMLKEEGKGKSLPSRPSASQGRGNIQRKGFVTLFFSVGKGHRVYPRDISLLLNTVEGISPGDVGIIRCLDSYSFAEVREVKAKSAITALKDTEFRGKKLTVNYARKKSPQKHS